MPTQGQRQEFLWRPNDNSATTRLRYDLEAEHWMRSINSYNIRNTHSSSSGTFAVIGLVTGMTINILFLLLSGILWLFTWIFTSKEKKGVKDFSYYNKKHGLPSVGKSDKKGKGIDYTDTNMNGNKNRSEILSSAELLAAGRIKNVANKDILFEKAAKLIANKRKASLTFLMEELEIGFHRACVIYDQLIESGILREEKRSSKKLILTQTKNSLNYFFENVA